MSNSYHLQEDEHIRSQQFCCISFIDPVNNDQLFDEECMHKFINQELNNQVSILKDIPFEEIQADYRVYYSVHYNDLVKALPEKFHSATHNKGIKVRGVYSTLEEAKHRIAHLSETMKKTEPIHIYLSENGKWTPFMSAKLTDNFANDLNYTLFDYQKQVADSKKAFNKRMENVRKEAEEERKLREVTVEEVDDSESEPEMIEQDTEQVEGYEPTKDYLAEDKQVDNQRFCCVSFVEPSVEVEEFMYTMCIKSFIHSFLAKQYNDYYVLNEDPDHPEFSETLVSVYDKYNSFKQTQVNEHTSVRIPCFKVRGCFPSEKEATEQAEYLQKIDGSVDVFVGHVGFWLPFAAPNKDDIHSVYNEKGLHEIHTTLSEHKRKIEENKNRLRSMNFDPDKVTYGQKKIIQDLEKNVHPSEEPVEIVEL